MCAIAGALAAAAVMAAFVTLAAGAPGGHKNSDLTTVLARLYAESMPSESSCAAASCSSAINFATSMQPDGSWEDINYKDQGRTEWADLSHWARLSTMAVALHCVGCGERLSKIVLGMTY